MDIYRQAFILIMDKEEDKFIALTHSPEFDISWKDNNNNSLLTQSIRYGLPKVFEQLMKLNADVSTPNGYGTTPLMWSIKEQEFEMFAKIIAKHPDLSIKNEENDTAAKMLLDWKDKKIIEQFILSLDNRQSLSLLESDILQTNHPFRDYSIGVIGIAKLQLKLNNSLSDKSIKEIKRKL
jgi:ankyrin repeat protein